MEIGGKHCKCKNSVEKIKNINRLQLVRIWYYSMVRDYKQNKKSNDKLEDIHLHITGKD